MRLNARGAVARTTIIILLTYTMKQCNAVSIVTNLRLVRDCPRLRSKRAAIDQILVYHIYSTHDEKQFNLVSCCCTIGTAEKA